MEVRLGFVTALSRRRSITHLLTVRDDDIVNILWISKLGQIIIHLLLLKNIEETSLRLSKKTREVLDSIAFGGSVDDAKHLLQMVLDELQKGQCQR